MPYFLVFKYQSRNEPSPLRETEVGFMNVLFSPHPSPQHAITNTCGAAAETAGKGEKTEEGGREVSYPHPLPSQTANSCLLFSLLCVSQEGVEKENLTTSDDAEGEKKYAVPVFSPSKCDFPWLFVSKKINAQPCSFHCTVLSVYEIGSVVKYFVKYNV